MKIFPIAGMAAWAALLFVPSVRGQGSYGTVTGDGVSSRSPGASDNSGTGTDSSLGVSHAESSGSTSHGATHYNNSSRSPTGYGTVTGPAVPADAPGASDNSGTGTDSSQGVTHSRSSP